MVNPVNRVHGAVDRRRNRVHGGPKAARTRGTVALRQHEVHEHSMSPVLIGVGRGGQGRRGGARGVLTRA
jgi:hypothetical protein